MMRSSIDSVAVASTDPNELEQAHAQAAAQACLNLFPEESEQLVADDFQLDQSNKDQPVIHLSAKAKKLAGKNGVEGIGVNLVASEQSATAIVVAKPQEITAPWYGKLAYQLIKRRQDVVLDNLEQVFGTALESEQKMAIAQGFYGHFIRFFAEAFFFKFKGKKARQAMVRIEGQENLQAAIDQGNGVLMVTGHFGNWEVATLGGIGGHSDYFGRFHFIRREVRPPFVNRMVVKRFNKHGFGVLQKTGSIEEIVELLEKNDVIVAPFDQYAGMKFGVASEFFGRPALTFKSLSVLAQCTGAPVIPASCWREKDGSHVLNFDPAIDLVTDGPTRKLVATNTKRFNQALERIILRHPEQWIWMHRRWK